MAHDSYPRAIRTILGADVRHRDSQYLNNRLEQDHRGVKGRYGPMRGFKCSRSAGEFRLDEANDAALDALPFGIVAMADDSTATSHNLAESRLSGLTPANVIGRHFFSAVAPYTNNFVAAYRFESEPVLDAVIDYVFTLGMQPSNVRLRLLEQPGRRGHAGCWQAFRGERVRPAGAFPFSADRGNSKS
jgi:photoactive yellow protein